MTIGSEWFKKAAAVVGEENIEMDSSNMEPYSHDEFATPAFSQLPEAVVKPGNEKEVSGIVALCWEMNIPVTARGGGTGLSAGCVPSQGAIVLSLERLNNVIDTDSENQSITVQSGMTLKRLYREVEEMNLFFPPHPGDEGAFVGGLVATNAGGARAVKYGTIQRFVLGLQVVLADGRVVELGGKYIKSSTGYNLVHLLLGSEGTLGIITQVTLSLLPPRTVITTLVAPFEKTEAAIGCVPALLKKGIIPCAVEFVEHSVIRCAERLLNKNWPTHDGSASLLLILDGASEDEVLMSAGRIANVLEENGALDVLLAEHKDRQAVILEIRSMLYEALRPGTVELFDICLPRSEVAAHVKFIRELEKKIGVPLPTYGHAADGNIHTHAMKIEIEDGVLTSVVHEWHRKYEQVRSEIYEDTIKRNGIISGEHGIGLVKKDYLVQNLGNTNVELMRSIKKALDPKGILNPGKIFSI